ncbi:MAG TPA: DUF4079 domain-containing protein [Cyanobacteria bacterium UBA12227]|nr:DUF4079 domain-containing protein [Cyanobacteria bacterium UBA12227]HAX87538.1 DUF4079 domain-containing protein [Cyanobacteria bacterium UBA11370]
MEAIDFFALIHPVLAVVVVFPIIGIVVHFAWQTRQRRLQTSDGNKSTIPPVVGREHVKLGRWLTGSVVGVTLVGLAYAIISKSFIENQLWSKNPTQAILIVLFFGAAITSLGLLYRAREKYWRAIFGTSTGLWLVVIGCQEGVFRRTNEWYWSHYYIGIAAALLMVFSLATVEEIYKDRSNRWRYIHIILNCFALLLFIGQGMTGSRDLFEIAFYKGLAK